MSSLTASPPPPPPPPPATATATATGPAELGTALEHRVVGLWWLLSRALPGDLSRTAASVLATLREEGPQRVTALAAHESIAQPSMSQLLQRLARKGLVERREDPADGRACRIAITSAGEQALQERAAARSAWLTERLAQLPATERDALAAALSPLDAIIGGGLA